MRRHFDDISPCFAPCFSHRDDAESRRLQQSFLVNKLAAKRGIIKWDLIKQYLGDRYTAQFVEVIR